MCCISSWPDRPSSQEAPPKAGRKSFPRTLSISEEYTLAAGNLHDLLLRFRTIDKPACSKVGRSDMIQGILLQTELHPIDYGTVETRLCPSSHNFLLDQTPVQLVFWTVRVDDEPAVFRQDGSVSALLWFATDQGLLLANRTTGPTQRSSLSSNQLSAVSSSPSLTEGRAILPITN